MVKPEEVWMNSSVLDAIDGMIEDQIKQQKFPGAVLIVGRFNKIVKRKAYGKRSLKPTEEDMTVDTIFDMASVSKPVGTTSMAMKLLENGKLNVTDFVNESLKNFSKWNKEKVQILHLLTHTSGLPDYAQPADVNKSYPTLEAYDAAIEYISNDTQLYPEGTGYTYSCLNFISLMRINEFKYGDTGDKFLRENVFEPLKMKDTTWFVSEDQRRRTAPTEMKPDNSSMKRGDVHDPLAYFYLSNGKKEHCPGNAGLFSTANDLSLYVRMLLNEGSFQGAKIFQPSTVNDLILKKQLSPNKSNPRTYGWAISASCPLSTLLNNYEGFEIVYHTGYTGTRVWMDKASRAFFILLTNRVHIPGGEAMTVFYRTADLVLRSLDIYKNYFVAHPICENETSLHH